MANATINKLHVNAQHLTFVKIDRFVTEASDIGIRPGQRLPDQLVIEPPIANGLSFVPHSQDDCSFTYVQANGLVRIRVFND